MRARLICASCAGVVFVAAASGQQPTGQQSTLVAIEQVSVIPMDRDRVLADQTVVVREGRIATVGATASTTLPANAMRIDGRGRFLIPALSEMHAHVPAGQATAQAERVLFMYVAGGVGTIRSMLGDPGHFALRERARRGEILAPTMYLAGPSFNAKSPSAPPEVVARVAEQKAAGYDLLKIHPGVTRGAFDALAGAAVKHGIRFAGHVPAEVGLHRALEAKYWTIDHLDGYVEALSPPGGPSAQMFGVNLVERADEARIPALVARTKASGVSIVPTQSLVEHGYGPDDVETMRAWAEMRYASPADVAQWVAAKRKNIEAFSFEQRRRYIGLRRRLIKALHDGGVGILLGSDAPQTWNVPGFSIHRELATYVAAGLTPYEALVTGTRAVAAHFGRLDRAGIVEPGKRADLVLLEGNPLQDIANTSRIAGVMIGGRWLPKSEIDRRLNEGR